MSEADSGTPTATEVETVASEPVEQPAVPVQERVVSNEEVMIAQTLSRIKKQSKQLEKTGRTIDQVLDSLKKADKERARHSKQVELQNKKVLSQIAQLQKKLAKPKSAAKPKSGKKKKARPKRR
ncbi:MAG: hypothetical protein ACREAY_09345 [Nitrososphaera sp.]|uniref:hypothetical protein n=1 Tax=Nitrososphaera sp. TaxID=1971748 RepID=UPI003D6DB8D9